MLEPVLAHYLMEYFADNKKRKRATKSVDIPTGTLIINYICVDITSCVSYRKKPAAQTAHLVFADTKANAEKPKELFFANAERKANRMRKTVKKEIE